MLAAGTGWKVFDYYYFFFLGGGVHFILTLTFARK